MKATPEMIAAGAEAARKYMEETGGNSLAVIWDAMWAAQPEQEPVAVVATTNEHQAIISWMCAPKPHGSYLYTTPPQRTWVGLTDEEFNEISSKHSVATIKAFVQEIELKLKEKNT